MKVRADKQGMACVAKQAWYTGTRTAAFPLRALAGAAISYAFH